MRQQRRVRGNEGGEGEGGYLFCLLPLCNVRVTGGDFFLYVSKTEGPLQSQRG